MLCRKIGSTRYRRRRSASRSHSVPPCHSSRAARGSQLGPHCCGRAVTLAERWKRRPHLAPGAPCSHSTHPSREHWGLEAEGRKSKEKGVSSRQRAARAHQCKLAVSQPLSRNKQHSPSEVQAPEIQLQVSKGSEIPPPPAATQREARSSRAPCLRWPQVRSSMGIMHEGRRQSCCDRAAGKPLRGRVRAHK